MMKRKTSISVFICTLVLATVAVAQNLSAVKPDSVNELAYQAIID